MAARLRWAGGAASCLVGLVVCACTATPPVGSSAPVQPSPTAQPRAGTPASSVRAMAPPTAAASPAASFESIGECGYRASIVTWLDLNRNASIAAGDQPLAAVTIVSTDQRRGTVERSDPTDANGFTQLAEMVWGCPETAIVFTPEVPPGYDMATPAAVPWSRREIDIDLAFGFAPRRGSATAPPVAAGSDESAVALNGQGSAVTQALPLPAALNRLTVVTHAPGAVAGPRGAYLITGARRIGFASWRTACGSCASRREARTRTWLRAFRGRVRREWAV